MTDEFEGRLAPGLYLVATPIGNLGDITLRALEVLRWVDRIACEDTRQTQKLLNHFEIATPTVSCHQHNERHRAVELLEALKGGGRIAVVSDAGMPGISDPGTWLAGEEAIAAGVTVIPIPGANAALSALVASGLPDGGVSVHRIFAGEGGGAEDAPGRTCGSCGEGRGSVYADLLRGAAPDSGHAGGYGIGVGGRNCAWLLRVS